MLALLVLIGTVAQPLWAQEALCGDAETLQHSFSSGASWSLCASVSDAHGLTVSSVHYRAPGDSSRSVLASAHLGQLLLHYHDSAQAEPQINPTIELADTDSELDTQTLTTAQALEDTTTFTAVRFTEQSCAGERLGTGIQADTLCAIVKNNRTLAKFAQRPSLNSQSWELAGAFARDALIWTTAMTFTEDGTIRSAVRLSGRASRTNEDARFASSLALEADVQQLTRATVLATWRTVFDLDTDAPDHVEQFDFVLDTSGSNRRAMQVSSINTETLSNIDRETFRGWRIVDGSGAGYYLDPSNSGFSYSSHTQNWAQFDIAFSRFNACEKHAMLNETIGTVSCGTSLDDFINAESLTDQIPVVWYSQTRTMDLTLEDWPVISELSLSFDLLPFDWTASSPFELIE